MSKRVGTDKDVEKLIKIARKHNVVVEITKGNHLKWVAPNGQIYFCGLTSSGNSQVVVRKVKKFLKSNVEGLEL